MQCMLEIKIRFQQGRVRGFGKKVLSIPNLKTFPPGFFSKVAPPGPEPQHFRRRWTRPCLGKKNTKETFWGANLHRLEWPIRMTLHFFFGLGISIKLHFPVLLGGGIPKYHLYDLYDTKKLHIYTYVCDSNCVLVDWTTALQVLSLADTSRCRNCAQFAHRCCLERRLLALDVGSADVGEWGIGRSLLLIPFPSSFSWQNCRTSSI